MKVNAFDLVSGQPWMITEDALRTILTIAERHAAGGDLTYDPQALSTREARPLMGTARTQVRDRVAIVPVRGPMFRRANLMTELSGATSTETLARDIRTALDDPLVSGILLEIDSPGGASAGINELSDMIFEARKRKPIYAYSDGQIASAAYFIASAADQIIIDPMAALGSIGVVLSVLDTRGAQARSGVRQIEIVSSVSPDKRIDVDDEGGRSKLQTIVDDMAAVMVAQIARNRGATERRVTQQFGRGGILIGERAVDAGMADRLGSFESVLAELSDLRHQPRSISMVRRAEAKGPISVATTAALRAALEAGHEAEEISLAHEGPDVEARIETARKEGGDAVRTELEATHAAALTAARTEAQTAERERVTGLQGICTKGSEQIVAEAVASGASVADTAIKIAQKGRQDGTSLVAQMRDAPAAVGAGGDPAGAGLTPKSTWGRITNKFNARRKGGKAV